MKNEQGLCAAPRRLRLRSCGCVVALMALSACSLVSFKSPEKPLSSEELNARILTRELSAQYIEAVERCGREITASEDDQQLLDNTLRWEIAAIAESRRAATQLAPRLSLLDTWAFAVQMQSFVAPGGSGANAFGTHQEAVRKVSSDYADGAGRIAQALLTPAEFADYQKFIEDYVRDYPFKDFSFDRTSVVVLWSQQKGAPKLIDAMGSIPQALADASQRMQIYGETIPPQMMRQTQLSLREAGYSKGDVQASLKRLDERLKQLGAAAESAPETVRGAVADVRDSVYELLDRLEAASRATTAALATQRVALFEDIKSEREAIVAAVDTQRQALTADAAKVADQVLTRSAEQARRVVREVVLLIILLALVLLGLPFAAGYYVGRARHARPRAQRE
jgi:hypothetical protein